MYTCVCVILYSVKLFMILSFVDSTKRFRSLLLIHASLLRVSGSDIRAHRLRLVEADHVPIRKQDRHRADYHQ